MVVVLPVPLTPTTRMTCGFGRGVDRQRLRDRREHLLDLLGEDRLHLLVGDLLVEAAVRGAPR